MTNITPNEIENLVRKVLGATRGELESHKISALGIAFLLSADKCGLNVEEALANTMNILFTGEFANINERFKKIQEEI
jgi:hypothetical protein